MTLKKLSTHKSSAKSLQLAQRMSTHKSSAKIKKVTKRITKKIIKKVANKSTKKRKLSTHKSSAKSLRLAQRMSTHKSSAKVKSEGKLIGLITHYFPHVQAAVIKLKAPLAVGETIKIKGHTTDLTQVITSMQMDRVTISNAKKSMEIGVQVSARVRSKDKVYKL